MPSSGHLAGTDVCLAEPFAAERYSRLQQPDTVADQYEQTDWLNWGPPIVATNSTMTMLDTLEPDPCRFYRVMEK